MQYAYCSMRPVIGQVIRNTRVQDSSFIADIHEWIYEAMEMMQTQQTLVGKIAELQVHFHKAKLPCGIRWIDGVEYQGQRLPEGGGGRPAARDRRIPSPTDGIGVFQTTNFEQLQTVENHIVYSHQLTDMKDRTALSPTDYYYTEMGYLNTSFPDGTVTLYYRAVPVDEDGMPMIPDNQNYKQALYWYCRAMMIGAGFQDKVFSSDHCFMQWEQIYAPRAISEIRMPSPEQMERRVNTLVRLLPPAGYFDSFFGAQPAEGFYDTKSL
jgi:hypothetical protein